ncbi:hypothetical protein EJB05_34130, partial [Eragrostis curvula]
MENGELRFIGVEDGPKSSACLCLCLMEEAQDGVAQWTRLGAIELEMLLPDGALSDNPYVYVSCSDYASVTAKIVGFVDGIDICFVGVRTRNCEDCDAVYMVELNSGRVRIRKVLEDCAYVFLFTSCCIPVIEVDSTREGPSSLDKLKMLMQRLLNRRIFRNWSTNVGDDHLE